MKQYLYCIYDKLAQQASDPFCAPNDEVAKRHFAFSLSRMPSVAKDCQLIELCTFDNESMYLEELELRQTVIADYSYIEEQLKNGE